jgi:hypothetical protein
VCALFHITLHICNTQFCKTFRLSFLSYSSVSLYLYVSLYPPASLFPSVSSSIFISFCIHQYLYFFSVSSSISISFCILRHLYFLLYPPVFLLPSVSSSISIAFCILQHLYFLLYPPVARFLLPVRVPLFSSLSSSLSIFLFIIQYYLCLYLHHLFSLSPTKGLICLGLGILGQYAVL